MQPRISRWENNSVAIERGPLVFSLKIDETWTKLEGDSLAPDWEVRPTTPWNYGLELDSARPAASIKVVEPLSADILFLNMMLRSNSS
jgi:hypothetical protein